MSALAPSAPPLASGLSARHALAGLGGTLAALVTWLAFQLMGQEAVGIPLGLGLAILTPTLALALLSPAGVIDRTLKIEAGFVCAVAFAIVAKPEPDMLSALFGALALMGAAVGAVQLAKAGAGALAWRAPVAAALALGALAAAHAIYYVAVSQDLMIADFMRNRLVSSAVAQRIAAGRIAPLLLLVAGSLKEDYSWLPALPTGVAMAAFSPLSRTVYQIAVALAFVGPALVALGMLARDLAARAGVRSPSGALALTFLGLAAFAAYPTGVVVAARGMPDVFGLVFAVLALRHGEKCWRALSLAPRHEALIAPLARRLTLALCLDLFAMFIFRRWYVFLGAGVLATLALCLAARPLQAAQFAWDRAGECVALGALVCMALAAPIMVDWLPNLRAHDYVDAYAAYRKPLAVDAMRLMDWVGLAPMALALVGAALLARQSADKRLFILTLGSSAIAAGLFLRIQSPAAHHYYLVAPALIGCALAPLLMLTAARRWIGAVALAALGALALTPSGAAYLPHGLFAPYGVPHAPRADLAELARLRAFVDARNAPDSIVCGIGSSYVFSGQLIGELWQLAPERPPFGAAKAARASVQMSDVDTVEGAPNPDMKNCATMIVGSPVQTHLIPDYQQTVIVPAREMLSGVGLGAHYKRTGEAFHLEGGVEAIVFERVTPLTDADMAALKARWLAARNAGPLDLRGDIDPENLSRSP